MTRLSDDDDDGRYHQYQQQGQPSAAAVAAAPHTDIDGTITISTSHPTAWKHP
jgi:hypothetical protein